MNYGSLRIYPSWLSWQRIHLQCRRPGFDPLVGKMPWRRQRLPTPVFWPGEYWGRKKSDMTEGLSLSGYMPSSGISGLYGSFIHSFLRILHTVPHSGCINLHSHQQCSTILQQETRKISNQQHSLTPRRRRWHPSPVLLPGKSHGRRSLAGCSPWGGEESDTTERLPFHFSTFMHWRRKWQPTPVFLPGGSQGRGSLVGCHLWRCTESDTTEVT